MDTDVDPAGSCLLRSLALIIEPLAQSAVLNMAIDQALLELATSPVLRVYSWDRPSVSVGYRHELTTVHFDGPVVRRWTGGGVVWHGDDATYSLIVPMGDPWSQTRPVESYRQIHGALVECLNATGHGTCRLAGGEDRKDGALCFEAPALFDIVRDSEKIAGAGQRRSRMGLLHQGSIKLQLAPEFWQRFAVAIAQDVRLETSITHDVQSRAEELVHTRYGTPEWCQLIA